MQGTLTQLDDHHTLGKLTTSAKSVADYFKDRLQASARGSSLPSLSSNSEKDGETCDVPRGGLGSSRLRFGIGEDGQVSKMGLGPRASKFGSLISGAFLASLSTTANEGDAIPDSTKSGLDKTSGSEAKKRKKAGKKVKLQRHEDKAIKRIDSDNEELEEPWAKEKKRKDKNQKATNRSNCR